MASIRDLLTKGKGYVAFLGRGDIFIALIIILTAGAAFGLGRLSAVEQGKDPVSVINASQTASATVSLESGNGAIEGLLVASKNGTKYHYPWCSGAQRIKEENKIWFSSKEEAERAGYTPAANCKGL